MEREIINPFYNFSEILDFSSRDASLKLLIKLNSNSSLVEVLKDVVVVARKF